MFISLFADDLKIAAVIKNHCDTLKLQMAINKLRKWCNENDLHLNLDKCVVMTISNKRQMNIFDGAYHYGDHVFVKVNEQRDLGVIVDSKLQFKSHINAIVSKATSTLGFVKRFCYDFRDINTLKSLYYALVQSILEYCSVVWHPYHNVFKKLIESVLKQFTMFTLRDYPDPNNDFRTEMSYLQRLSKLEMQTSQRRRISSLLMFFFDAMNRYIHAPLIWNEFIVNESAYVRPRTEAFRIKNRTLRNDSINSFNQMCKLANITKNLFCNSTSRMSFKSALKALTDSDLVSNATNLNYIIDFL